MAEVNLVNGVPWTQNNVEGLYYYVMVSLHADLEKTIKFYRRSIGIFVPTSPTYTPIRQEFFTVQGVQTLPGIRDQQVTVTVQVPFTFWPPILAGQQVPEEYRARAEIATTNARARITFTRLPNVTRDVTIIPIRRPRPPPTRQGSTDQGGRRGYQDLPNRYPLPGMSEQNGQHGYSFELTLPQRLATVQPGSVQVHGLMTDYELQTSSITQHVQQFVPWTPTYQPVVIPPVNCQAHVIPTDPMHYSNPGTIAVVIGFLLFVNKVTKAAIGWLFFSCREVQWV